jgi:hypothetical protein
MRSGLPGRCWFVAPSDLVPSVLLFSMNRGPFKAWRGHLCAHKVGAFQTEAGTRILLAFWQSKLARCELTRCGVWTAAMA